MVPSTYECYIRCNGYVSFLMLPSESIDRIAYSISTFDQPSVAERIGVYVRYPQSDRLHRD